MLPEHKAVLEGETEAVLTEESLLPIRLRDLTLLLGPRSFFQTNTVLAQALYDQAAAWADEADPTVVWDLYCGVGGFALHLAGPGRRVVGVETSPEAVAAARGAAARMTSRTPAGGVTFVVGDATRPLDAPAPDLVLVNPPRRGIGPDLAAWLETSPASHLVYSSCHVDSLALDLGRMSSWRVRAGRVVDMFPQTRHVETVLLLQRR